MEGEDPIAQAIGNRLADAFGDMTAGPPAGPPSGPPDSSSGPSIEMPDKPDL